MTLQEMSVEYRAQAQVLQGRIEALKQTQDTLDHGAARDQMALRIQTLQTIWRKPGTWRSFWNITMRGVPPQCALHAIDDIGSPAQTCWCTPASWRRTMGRSCSVCATPWAMPCGRRSPAKRQQVLFLYYNENYTMAEIGAQLGWTAPPSPVP